MKKIAIACQGGGAHCAFTGGALARLLDLVELKPGGADGKPVLSLFDQFEIVSLSGTSGGAISAYLAWLDLLRLRAGKEKPARFAVERFWETMEARWFNPFPYDSTSNWTVFALSQLEGVLPFVSPTPNVLTRQIQQDMMEWIRKAAGELDFLPTGNRPGGVRPEQAEGLKYEPRNFPALLIGAANVDESEFSPFLATPGCPPLVEQIIASTALPDIFPAISLSAPEEAPESGAPPSPKGPRTAHYWDGLFSQNPPISDLLAFKDPEARPDEIWIVRINPAQRQTAPYTLQEGPPLTSGEIQDRRNELAGNLSLEQEKRFVRKINKMLRNGEILPQGGGTGDQPTPGYKQIDLWGIALEGPAEVPEDQGNWRHPTRTRARRFTRSLGHSSKLLRDPCFLRELHDLGMEAVDEFLAHRQHTPAKPPQTYDGDPPSSRQPQEA